MYELIQVSECCYYIDCPAKIGLVTVGDGTAVLIDSGNDKSAGKKVKRILEEKGLALRAILNTHSHADHIGGNRFLQTQTGCDIFAAGIEADFTRHPILEPSYLYGANPPSELRHKFLLAEESEVKELLGTPLPAGIDVLPLRGHSFDMVGFHTADNIVYLGDCLSSAETLDKYKIGFIWDVGEYLNTLRRVYEMEAALFIPSHTAPTKDIRPLAELNIKTVLETGDKITELTSEPLCFEELLSRLFSCYSLNMSFEQYALVGSTVKSYLTWLKADGRMTAEIRDNKILWKRK